MSGALTDEWGAVVMSISPKVLSIDLSTVMLPSSSGEMVGCTVSMLIGVCTILLGVVEIALKDCATAFRAANLRAPMRVDMLTLLDAKTLVDTVTALMPILMLSSPEDELLLPW